MLKVGLEGNMVETLAPKREILSFIERYIDPRLAVPWAKKAWPGLGMLSTTVPTGYTPQPYKLNSLWWPGATSDWANINLLMSANQVNRLSETAWGVDGNQQNPLTFIMDSFNHLGEGESIVTQMYAFPPKPLSAAVPQNGIPETEDDVVNTNNVYLVTLVDQRYYWQFSNVGNLQVDLDYGIDWTLMANQVVGSIQANGWVFNFNMDPVDPAYLNASSSFILPYASAPAVLDVIAANVGMYTWFTFDMKLLMQKPQTARDSLAADFANNPGRKQIAGGETFVDRPFYW